MLQLGPLLSQPLGDKDQVYPSTLTRTHVKVSLSCCSDLAPLACHGPCCGGLGVFSFPCAVGRLHPMFLCSASLQQRSGKGTHSASLSPVPVSPPLPFLSPEVEAGE